MVLRLKDDYEYKGKKRILSIPADLVHLKSTVSFQVDIQFPSDDKMITSDKSLTVDAPRKAVTLLTISSPFCRPVYLCLTRFIFSQLILNASTGFLLAARNDSKLMVSQAIRNETSPAMMNTLMPRVIL
jgi:hypothetical protein